MALQQDPSLTLEYGKDPTAVILRDEHHPSLSFCIMGQLRRRQQFCDVEVKKDGARLPAHRVVLASASPYFLNLLSSNSSQSEIKVEDPKLDVSALELLMEFMYTSVLRITENTAQALCCASKVLEMDRIERACCKFMIKNLSPRNCITRLHFAQENGYVAMQRQCRDFIAGHLEEFANVPQYQSLSAADMTAILGSESLAVPSQQVLLKSLLLWVKHDAFSRQRDLYQRLANVKIPQVVGNIEQVLEIVRSLPIGTKGVLDNLRAYFEKLNPTSSTKSSSEESLASCDNKRPGIETPQESVAEEDLQTNTLLFAAGGTTAHSTTNTVERYDSTAEAWLPTLTLPRKKSHAALVGVDKKLYSIGGFDGSKRISTVDVYDLQQERWTQSPPMDTARSGFGVAVIGNTSIYCVGGYSGSQDLSSVEVLDLKKNHWKKGPELQQPRSYVQAATINDTIYAVGGTDGNCRLKSVEKLAPTDGQWTSVADMNIPRSRPGVEALNGKLYAIGGYSGSGHLSLVECYNPQTNRWTLVQSMSVPRNSPGVSVMNGCLFVAGGHDGRKMLKSVEMYDPEKKQWSKVASMQTARCDFGMVTIVATGLRVAGTWT